MAKAKCVFCGKEQEDYKGTYLIKNDGTTLYFSSSKCMRNHLKLKRDRRRVRWTEAFHLQRKKRYAKQKELEEKEAQKSQKKEDEETKKMDEMRDRAVKKAEKIIKEKTENASK